MRVQRAETNNATVPCNHNEMPTWAPIEYRDARFSRNPELCLQTAPASSANFDVQPDCVSYNIVTVLSVSAYAYENAQGPVKQVGYRGRSLASNAGTATTQQQQNTNTATVAVVKEVMH